MGKRPRRISLSSCFAPAWLNLGGRGGDGELDLVDKPVWKEQLFKEEVSHLLSKSLPERSENRGWEAGMGGLQVEG